MTENKKKRPSISTGFFLGQPLGFFFIFVVIIRLLFWIGIWIWWNETVAEFTLAYSDRTWFVGKLKIFVSWIRFLFKLEDPLPTGRAINFWHKISEISRKKMARNEQRWRQNVDLRVWGILEIKPKYSGFVKKRSKRPIAGVWGFFEGHFFYDSSRGRGSTAWVPPLAESEKVPAEIWWRWVRICVLVGSKIFLELKLGQRN